MRKFMTILGLFMVFSAVMPTRLSAGQPAAGKPVNLTFASVAGSVYYFPAYVAREKGWFGEAGLNLREVGFTNGPVMVESLASNGWDVGMSGIGGILPGVLAYDGVLLTPVNSDDGTQYLFVRNDSPIVAAGTGKNSLDPRIYGDADSWKGKRVLCNTGAVLQYFLIKVLGGFNLKPGDVQFMAMDVATAGSAFRAGEGDIVAMTGSGGALQMLNDKDEYTAVAHGPWAKTGLMSACFANKNSLADPVKREAMLIFLKVYHDAVAWIADKNNYETTVNMMMDFSDEMGNAFDRPTAAAYLALDPFYTMREAVDMMTAKAPGKNYSVMEDNLINVLNFFIDSGSRRQGDAEKFLGHVDPSLMSELANRVK
ncbi:MAG: ABC transporter substrate-binding protein [Planctomycetota bacterium]|nr:ABC transporter substrate-binding protein [Planctomycetota bacterium]